MMDKNILSKVSSIIIPPQTSLIDALKKMDEVRKKLLLVMDESIFIGLISIGDIQRSIIDNKPLELEVGKIIRKDFTVTYVTDSEEKIKNIMLEKRVECMPVLDENNQLRDVYFWENIFEEKKSLHEPLDLPVIVMAGGKGTRLRPLTNVIPKPLIPLNSKTVVETIMDNFKKVGCEEFYMSVNYKAETIEQYFRNTGQSQYSISYFYENKPLGTAGSLSLLKGKLNKTFFVSNCDIIIDDDYTEILKYHRNNKNELTIVSAIKHYSIPYGTLHTKEDGVLTSLEEKPELTFQINTGFYILEPHLLDEIPVDTFFHITELIENIKNRNGRVGVFPISEKSWKDIGEWAEYLRNIDVY
jgi:dTDP-glucose pyrophosphorylase/predicted transcriptional regulator